MKRIPVTPDTYAIVDDALYTQLCTIGSWNLAGRGYASCYVRGSGARWPKRIYMHHVVLRLLGITYSGQVDHRDRNRLNNQVYNLRPASNRQNNTNCGPKRNNTTGFRGVSEVKRATRRRWRAEIRHSDGREHLGSFPTPEAAAHAYDKAALKYHGTFAFLNLPTDGGARNESTCGFSWT